MVGALVQCQHEVVVELLEGNLCEVCKQGGVCSHQDSGCCEIGCLTILSYRVRRK